MVTEPFSALHLCTYGRRRLLDLLDFGVVCTQVVGSTTRCMIAPGETHQGFDPQGLACPCSNFKPSNDVRLASPGTAHGIGPQAILPNGGEPPLLQINHDGNTSAAQQEVSALVRFLMDSATGRNP